MASIRPFRGLRFSAEAGKIGDIVAPPYDVLSPAERDAFAEKNPHNIVHLTLPEGAKEDRSKFVKYARSAARLEEWRRDGSLQLEPRPSFYRYTQTFAVPGNGGEYKRTSLIVLLELEPYENGVVLPHEQTFPKHKEDRLRILEATNSHLECIYGLYEDSDRATHELVASAPGTEVALLESESGLGQRLERIDDPASLQAIVAAMADKKLWIADGHHRYETALAFKAQRNPGPDGAENYMMMAVSSMTDPGLVLLPTHRILRQMPISGDELRERLSEQFEIERCANSELGARLAREAESGRRAFGVALPGGQGYIARVKDLHKLGDLVGDEGSQHLRELDVTILHRYIFEKLLGLSGHDFFDYTRDEAEAVASVESGSPAAFLMNPPTVDDMRTIALGGEKMPQKSTYYYPKLWSGLVLWSLKDFEP